MKIRIVDRVWTIELQTKAAYFEQHGDNSYAITYTDTGTIYFRDDCLDLGCVRHELFHAYFDSTMVDSSDLDMLQTEEVAASLMGRYGSKLVSQSNRVYKHLVNKTTHINK